MITWPAILKHSDDDELIYISSQSAWNNDADLHTVDYNEADFLIDLSGKMFRLTSKENQRVVPEDSGDKMELEQVLGLVKAHAAQKGSCCVAKLYAPSIAEAFKIVASLDET